MAKTWKQFELAVAALLKALDPSAVVSHDTYIADQDTGTPRQRDVWIETTFGGHFAIKILVSCKRKSAKISQQDMDAFIGELRSSGAHKGVLYSYRGFTKPALAKAERLGISCCVLHSDSPPHIPEMLAFSAFHFAEEQRLTLDPAPPAPGLSWQDIIELPTTTSEGDKPAIEQLAQLYHRDDDAVQSRLGELPPPCRVVEVPVSIPGQERASRMIVESFWRVHRAKIEAWCVNGSYSLTDKDFKGTIATPAVDTWSNDPGPGWELVDAEQISGVSHIAAFVKLTVDLAGKLRAWAKDDQHSPHPE